MTQFGECRTGRQPGVSCAHGGLGCDVDHHGNALSYLREQLAIPPLTPSGYSDRGMETAMQQSMDVSHLQGQVNALAVCVEFLLEVGR